MGGGAMNVDLPIIQLKAASSSSSSLPSPSTTAPNNSSLTFPASATSISGEPLKQTCTASCCCCPRGTCARVVESVHGKGDMRASGSSFNAIFGSVPSLFEVESAISALQNFIRGIPDSGSEFNQLQQLLSHPMDVGSLLSNGYGRVNDAFRLLQTEPSIKRLVVSLASDKAVWDAVMNNKMVRQLRDSSGPAESYSLKGFDEETDAISGLLRWVMDATKAKISELIQKFQALLDEILQPHLGSGDNNIGGQTKDDGVADDRVRSSLLLSVVILMIVVLTRAQRGWLTP